MPQCRRRAIQDVKPTATTHAGLWFDKYLREQTDRDTSPASGTEPAAVEVIKQVAACHPSETYQRFYGRWRASLLGAQATTKEAHALGRMAIGLGGENPIETAITLHRTYGVPYIPGSALKGLAASFARNRLSEEWRPDQEAYQILFGTTESAGYVTFFDALYVPRSGKHGIALYPDVITVHHPEYYRESQPPADWDNPTPVAFLSATGTYLLAVAGDPEWVTKAYEILNLALRIEGIGAKTSSGYGRMRIEGMVDSVASAEPGASSTVAVDPNQQSVDQFAMELATLDAAAIAPQIGHFVDRWRSSELPDDFKQQMAQAILDIVEKAPGKAKKRMKSKSWYEELSA